MTDRATIATMEITLEIFALLEIALCSFQLVINGPKTLWVRSHLCKRGEERANANAAKIMKPVVGNKGTNMPIVPIPTDIQPRAIQRIRLGEIGFMPYVYVQTSDL